MKQTHSLSSCCFSIAFAFAALAATGHAQTILPDAIAGQPYHFQISTSPPQAAGATYTASGLPAGLSIGASTGLISGATATVGTYKGTLNIVSNSTTSAFSDQITVDPAAGTPVITSSGGPVGTVGSPFSYAIVATNNPTGYTMAALPPGLASSGALISGTPTVAGLYFTSISANNASGQGAILVFMFTIAPAGPVPSVTSALVISAPAAAPFSYAIGATNAPSFFSAVGLPAGLSLNSATGVIAGTPAAPGVSSVVIAAANSFGSSLPVNLNLTIGNYSSITSATAATGTVGTSFTYAFQSSNGPSTYTLTGLPAGLSFNSTNGVITGSPTTAGIYTLNANAINALGTGAPTALTLTVNSSISGGGGTLSAPLILVQPGSLSATVASAVQFSVTATGAGTLSYQWSHNGIPITGATAPSLLLAGITAADAGTYAVTVTNAIGSATSAPAGLSLVALLVPPAITSQPANSSSSVGTAATFTVGASGSPPLTYQWLFNGLPIASPAVATFTLPSVKLTDAGSYSLVVSNASGQATSLGAILTVSATPIAPIFQYQPTSTSATAGGTVTLSVGVVGTSPIAYQWLNSGVPVAGATASSLTFVNAQPANAGTYSVKISNPGGSVTSANASLAVLPIGSPPVPVTIVQQPVPLSIAISSAAAFSVGVSGDAAITYQWRRNQAQIAGATAASFTISNAQASDAGTYDVLVANGFSATISFPTPLTVTPAVVPSHLMNVSGYGYSGAGSQALTVGISVTGTGTMSGLLRAVGPTLASFGVAGVLAAPQLTLLSPAFQPLAFDASWGGTAALGAAFGQAGAFPLAAASLDSALLASLAPGLYTLQVAGANAGTGVVLVEAYDADSAASPTARVSNGSVRGFAGAGTNPLTLGFTILGTTSKQYLVRAVGPTLAGYGVSGALANPQLTVFNLNDNVMGSNAAWGGTAAISAAIATVSAFPLALNSQDSAVLVTLAPGAYTAQVSGVNGSTGVVLLEVYELP